jgi:hypothetical protein
MEAPLDYDPIPGSDYDYNLDVDIKDLFLSDGNRQLLTHSIFKLNRKLGGTDTIEETRNLVETVLVEFTKRTNFDGYLNASFHATGLYDWVEILRALNRDFMKLAHNYLTWNAFVPTRATIEVGDRGKRVEKKMSELQAEDYGTIDVWAVQEVSISNDVMRYNNRIPVWQRSMNIRHYDRSNEGLAQRDSSRASLENFVPKKSESTIVTT